MNSAEGSVISRDRGKLCRIRTCTLVLIAVEKSAFRPIPASLQNKEYHECICRKVGKR